MKNRIVVIGNKGFIGSEIYHFLIKKKYNVLGISKNEIDLTANNCILKLKKIINNNDTIIFVSAIAPCKDLLCIKKNVSIIENLLEAMSDKNIRHMINISSDAVYSDTKNKISEQSETKPTTFHGIMHMLRESLLTMYYGDILTTIRPTLVYGLKDPHNGYGPNKFRRLINDESNIILFGEGEEKRDHVYVGDIAELTEKIIKNTSYGIFNAVSGQTLSFNEMANYQKKLAGSNVSIINTPRIGPMHHLGLRQFKRSRAEKAFEAFEFTRIKRGIKRLMNEK